MIDKSDQNKKIDDLQSRVTTLQSQVTTLQSQVTTLLTEVAEMKPICSGTGYILANEVIRRCEFQMIQEYFGKHDFYLWTIDENDRGSIFRLSIIADTYKGYSRPTAEQAKFLKAWSALLREYGSDLPYVVDQVREERKKKAHPLERRLNWKSYPPQTILASLRKYMVDPSLQATPENDPTYALVKKLLEKFVKK
jgi:hypothetical protein